jgi:hypothetical protein
LTGVRVCVVTALIYAVFVDVLLDTLSVDSAQFVTFVGLVEVLAERSLILESLLAVATVTH